jgi:hypothetical protein
MLELGGAQVSFESQRLLDCYGACTGHSSENADGVHIYSQVPSRGTPYWVELPTEAGLGAIWGPRLDEIELGRLVALWVGFKHPVLKLRTLMPGCMEYVTLWGNECRVILQ